MPFGWQDLLVTLLVTVAAAYLARRAWSLVSARRQGGCGSAVGAVPRRPRPMSCSSSRRSGRNNAAATYLFAA